MRRKLKELVSLTAVSHLLYIPTIILKIVNWYPYLLNYIGLKNEARTYRFRNGIKLKTNEGIDTATIAVIFIKKDYGKIKDNSTVIDVGANIGIFSIYAASTAKNVMIYAYEPMPTSYRLLLENINLNKLENNIFPFNLGIAASKGKRKLFLASTSPFHSLYSESNDKYIEIDTISLEDVFNENKIDSCDILKIDCEGAEFEILYSTPKYVLQRIKEIRLEYHNQRKAKYNVKDLIKFLQNNNFKLTKFREDGRNSGIAWFMKI
ncbi:MAG: FkbM family methyltransferase [Candidatus Methanomethylicia archaeon]